MKLFDSVNEGWNGTRSVRLHLTLAAAALALTGCTTVRYTPVYCIAADQELPAEPPKVSESLTGQADQDVRIIAGSAIRLRAWGRGLNDILENCREARP